MECPLNDPTVDELLTDAAFERNIRLLRRFRNGVYHYQPNLINERLLAFLSEGEHAVTWAFLIHSEFKRVVWEISHPQHVAPQTQLELAEAIRGIVDWLPSDIPEAAPDHAAQHYRDVAEMILKAGNPDTPHSRNLLEAVENLRIAADQADTGWARHKRTMIEALKEQNRDPTKSVP